jgi:hypothetical protein
MGRSEPIADTLLRSVVRDLRNAIPTFRSAALKRLEKMLGQLECADSIPAHEIVAAINELVSSLQRSGKAQGLFIIIDELGKFLEFAARHPSKGDIFTLQLLAEATAGFDVPGLLLFTVLHQSFDRYAVGLRPSVRDEWAKVQGRFDDVGFQDSPEEFLLLISNAISQKKDPIITRLRARVRVLAERAVDLNLVGRGMKKAQIVSILQDCAPLHPVTVLTLARLCRKFGQNQRSLFSFLVSREPKGFLAFLEQNGSKEDCPLYALDHLYDYTNEAIGSGLSVGEGAGRWAEVQGALEKCANASSDELRTIKTIGLLSAVGSYGELKPSPQVLGLALTDLVIDVITDRLVRQSLIVFRKHSNSFSFWEGSDFDLEASLAQARQRLPEQLNTAETLRSLWTTQAIVAKRHSISTGTLRYFVSRFTDAATLTDAFELHAQADGILLYVLPTSEAERQDTLNLITNSQIIRERGELIIAAPRSVDAVKEAMREVELLTWVQHNAPELRGDAIARRELRSRIAFAEEHLAYEVDLLFSPGRPDSDTAWFHRGLPISVDSAKSFTKLLSAVCDQVYCETPIINNELINRSSLSSAAAAARRNLIEAMITKSDQVRLGFSGTPPEVSIYSSLLEATGVHRQEQTGFCFGPPSSTSSLNGVWTAICQFFEGCELHKKPVLELFSRLQAAPFGMKMGPIPVLFCAAVMAHDTEIALYEGGVFVPDISIEVFERLLRTPEKFEIRRYSIEGIRREVFNQFADLLESPGKHAAPKETLVEVVRPLFRFFNRLPPYSRQTKAISPEALAIRDALFAAREPDVLLFEELPVACGILPFNSIDQSGDEVKPFFHELKRGLLELQRAYDDLLSSSQQMLFRAFGVTGSQGRKVVRFRARNAFAHAVEPRLRALLMHLMDDELEDVAWIEAVTTLLAGKPPKSWSDSDRARFEVTLGQLVRNFRHIESLVKEITRRGSDEGIGEMLRIGITDHHSKDFETVVVVEPHNMDVLSVIVERLDQALAGLGAEDNPSLALAALGTVTRRLLTSIDNNTKSAKSKSKETQRG